MLKVNKNINYDASITIDDAVVASINANFYGTNVFINKTIHDVNAYETNKEEIGSDIDQFEASVIKDAKAAQAE